MATQNIGVAQFQLRRDTAQNWATVNPVLLQGEMGYETDTDRMKIGNGVSAWNSLSYFSVLFERDSNGDLMPVS